MNLVTRIADAFGFVRKAAVPRAFQNLEGGGWYGLHRSPFDFDRDIRVHHDAVLANWSVFACMTLIAGDIGKLRVKLMDQDARGIWSETSAAAFSPVLRKPNDFQTRQKFLESWILSKLSNGNAYILKERDNRGVVTELYVLDPCAVIARLTRDGEVFYELNSDYLSGIPEGNVIVPASEIIHDRMWCPYHPLIGVSPIYACGLAATQGLAIQKDSARFFQNQSRPGGVLTTPGFLDDEQAATYKRRWNEMHSGAGIGSTAVLGNGLKYEAIGVSAEDAQLVEQLKMTAEMVCSTFHVPGWKIGVGTRPAYQNAEIENQVYYDTCLQPLIEAVEACLDEGLGLPDVQGHTYGTELDLDALLRMDQAGQTKVLADQVGAGITAPNEARAKLNMQPAKGGESPMLQQQNYSLAALAKRDSGDDPFGKAAPPASTPASPAAEPPTKGIETILVGLVDSHKQLELGLNDRLAEIDKRLEAKPELEGAKRFAERLKRALEMEPI